MENVQKGQKLEGTPGADDMQANLDASCPL